ncbi:MAG: hypothetical protein R3B91_10465 [Planctomycetaceae bacterium]
MNGVIVEVSLLTLSGRLSWPFSHPTSTGYAYGAPGAQEERMAALASASPGGCGADDCDYGASGPRGYSLRET